MAPVTQRCSFSTATQTKDCLSIGTPIDILYNSIRSENSIKKRRIKITVNTVSAKDSCPGAPISQRRNSTIQQQHKPGVMDALFT